MALRLVESGVRMVQVYFGNFQPWDSHDDIRVHRQLAQQADGPIAALLDDLKARGLFEDTLLIVGSEFGRTPMIQNSGLERVCNGRDHNVPGYTLCSPEAASRAVLLMAQLMISDLRRSRSRFTSMTCMPRFCICSVWTTRV